MNVSTLLKRTAFVTVLGLSGMCLSAQTFVYEGLIYKAGTGTKKTQLTVQKPGTKVTITGMETVAAYEGDITVPGTVTYDGTEYKVVSIGNAFKGTDITSIWVNDEVTTLSRGAFQGCPKLVKAHLPLKLENYQGDEFNTCEVLEEVNIPCATGKKSAVNSNNFNKCVALKKIIIEDGTVPLTITAGAMFNDAGKNLEELVIKRSVAFDGQTMDDKLGRNKKMLKKVTIGGSCDNIPASFFAGSSALSEIVFESEVTSIGTNAFENTGFTEITLPASLTSVSASLFQGCKNLQKVTLGENVTSIASMAFYNSTVAEVNLPAGLTSIGQMAFSGTSIGGKLEFPAGLKSVGIQAYAKAPVSEVVIPASLTSIGDGAFMGCSSIAKFTVDAANEVYKSSANGDMLMSADAKTLITFAVASETTSITGDFEELKAYAAYNAAKVNLVNLPACTVWGDYCVAGTAITDLTVKGTVGRYVAANCAALKNLTIGGTEVPFGIAKDCAALDNVKFTDDIVVVKQEAFSGTTALKELALGKTLSILEADCFAGSAVETLSVGAANPAGMAQGVFTEASNITVKVPVDLVDTYKNAGGWSYLTIVGDANVPVGPADMGMPNGLYYAGEDGQLHCAYADGTSTSYDVGGADHTFQLAQFKNRIYGASAGKKFTYSATGSVDGDGKLYYISKIGNTVFQAVVLDNKDGNAYKDPFGLYIYGDSLYVNDRNVCVRRVSADALSLPINYPSWMENNWMGWYNNQWAYGCIKCGWAITQGVDLEGNPDPVFWIGMKYNGNGIWRFRKEHIGNASGAKAAPEDGMFLNKLTPIFTTFNIDEAHGHLYIYLEIASGDKPKGGLYRINLADLEANPNPATFAELNPVLIDGAPVKWEGSATNEHVGISQLSFDEKGEYMYWCYRAPSESEAATTEGYSEVDYLGNGHYPWAEKFDAANPLHQSGIKRIRLGEENPKVEMVVPGVNGYGVVPVNYEGSSAVEDIVSTIVDNKANLLVNGNLLTAVEDAEVYVYDMAGVIVAYGKLAAGESMNVAHLANGAYIAVANGAALKFVK